MGARRSGNTKRKERMKRCWERSKTVTRPAREAANVLRMETNLAIGLEPVYRHGAEVKNPRTGKITGTRRDTHAWSVARQVRAAERAAIRSRKEWEREQAEAAETAIEKALRELAAKL